MCLPKPGVSKQLLTQLIGGTRIYCIGVKLHDKSCRVNLLISASFQFVRTRASDAVPGIGLWVKSECPARIDVAGGWSDTPPITYEHGGAVLDAAITVDGQKPIGAKVKRIDE